MKNLKCLFVQNNAVLGDLDHNAALILEKTRAAYGMDLVVFPECFLTGYPLEDLVLRQGFISRVQAKIDALAEDVRAIGGPAVLFGAPCPGANLARNAAVLIRSDGSVSVVSKTELPNSDVFDEVRVFDAADRAPKPLMLGDIRLGVMICEDMWHGKVARELSTELADVLIVLNGSPFEEDKHEKLRLRHAQRRTRETGLPLMYLNLVGGQDEIFFDGASFLLNRSGDHIAQLPFGQNADLTVHFAENDDGRFDIAEHALFDEGGKEVMERHGYPDRLESMYTACVVALRDYVEKTKSGQVFLGVSGGVDSALVAAMAVDALGADKVIGVMMPSQYTGDESVSLADELMANLRMHARTIAIGGAFDSIRRHLDGVTPRSESALSLAEENMQARIRGMTLMALSNAEGGIVLSTGNKSEMSVGYATLYGDMCGGYNPLKDIYKTDVWALCRWRNANRPRLSRAPVVDAPIPAQIIDRPPTAELKPGQSDEQSLGSYPVLDALLRGMIEGNLDAEAARRAAERVLGETIAPAHADRIASLVKNAEYKRRQAPPGVKLTSRSFGKGWRYPIANHAAL